MATTGFLSNLFNRSSTEAQRPTAPAAEHADGRSAATQEGQLLRGKGSAPVYKIEDGRKRWIVTEAVFLRHGFAWADVRVVPKATVDSIPSGDNIT